MAAKTIAPEAPVTARGNIPVFVPKTDRGDDDLFVAVNGKRILIQKGKTVYLSPAFAEAVQNSLEAQRKADAFIEANAQ